MTSSVTYQRMLKTPRGAMPWLRQALALFAVWTAVGLVFALPRLADAPDWRLALGGSLAEWWSWGMMTPFIVVLNERLAAAGKRGIARLAWQAALGVGVTIAYVYVDTVLTAWLQRTPFPDLASGRLLLDALRGMFLWAMIVYTLVATAWPRCAADAARSPRSSPWSASSAATPRRG